MRRSLVGIVATIVATGGLVATLAAPAAAATPGVTVGDVAVHESDLGAGSIKIPVDLSVPPSATVKVPYTVAPASDGSAQSADGSVKKGTLTFNPGVAAKVITFTETGDILVEPDQHFVVNLGTPTGATFADPTGAITIEDNDNGIANPLQVSLGNVTVAEADGGVHYAYLPILLSQPAPSALSVRFQTNCATASMLTDFTAKTTGRINFNAGQQSKVLKFTILADASPEQLKQFTETLTSTVSTLEIVGQLGVATIVDDDGPWQGGNAVPGFQREGLSTSTFGSGAVGSIEQVSVTPTGGQPHYVYNGVNGEPGLDSSWATTSADGSSILLESNADNLVAGDTNGLSDLFVRDRRTGTTERVSLKGDGSQITGADFGVQSWSSAFLFHAAISADGRYVVFDTPAKLLPIDAAPVTGQSWIQPIDTYLYDRVTHAVELESVKADGTPAGGMFGRPDVSANGRYVLLSAHGGSSALVPNDQAGLRWAFVRDRQTGTVTKISNSPLHNASISDDGSTVVGYDPGVACPGGAWVVAVDIGSGAEDQVDVTTDGEPADRGVDPLASYTVSATGRHVGFTSHGWNMVPGQTPQPNNYVWDRAFLRDRQLHTTTPLTDIALHSEGVDIDGTVSRAVQLLGGRNEVIDTATLGTTGYGLPISTTVPYTDNLAYLPGSLSSDGRYLVFTSSVFGGTAATAQNVYIQRIG